ncbi:CidA/LrgA family protein [Companilactobacillus sp. DQM5]|uniref:CidA/LrgA family protein n=1 Tax=Companilactobacillus sp. DQM5 TaxID=3463359 RepID=UPI0040597880
MEKDKKDSPILIQVGIMLGILFISNILSKMMPASFPVPTPVWGLVILYLLLTFKVIKIEQVEKISNFFIGILGFLFVPSGIQLYQNLEIIKEDGLRLILVIIFSTIILLVVIAYTSRILINIKKKISHERK